MNHCLYDFPGPPWPVEIIRAWCHKCGWVCPVNRIGTYVRDVVMDGILFHVVEVDPLLVCERCGHSAGRLLRPCKTGNSAATVANADAITSRTLAALPVADSPSRSNVSETTRSRESNSRSRDRLRMAGISAVPLRKWDSDGKSAFDAAIPSGSPTARARVSKPSSPTGTPGSPSASLHPALPSTGGSGPALDQR